MHEAPGPQGIMVSVLVVVGSSMYEFLLVLLEDYRIGTGTRTPHGMSVEAFDISALTWLSRLDVLDYHPACSAQATNSLLKKTQGRYRPVRLRAGPAQFRLEGSSRVCSP
jgi:hypothetical protein